MCRLSHCECSRLPAQQDAAHQPDGLQRVGRGSCGKQQREGRDRRPQAARDHRRVHAQRLVQAAGVAACLERRVEGHWPRANDMSVKWKRTMYVFQCRLSMYTGGILHCLRLTLEASSALSVLWTNSLHEHWAKAQLASSMLKQP